MAKIVIDAREFTTTTGRYVYRLVRYLQEVDQENEYVILLKPHDAENWKPKAVNFSVVVTPYKEFSFGEQLGFAWQLYRLKPDLVHFGMVQQPLLYFGRSVTTMHDLTTIRFRNPTKNAVIFTIKQQVYKFVNFWAAHKNKHIFTPTEFVKNDVVKYTHISPEKVTVTYEAADPIDAEAEPIAALEGKGFVMYVGRPLPHKNLGRLIEAMRDLRERHPDLLLVLAGKKDVLHEQYAHRAAELGLQDAIHFTGFVSEGQLKWLYQNTVCYAFPSLSEGFGLPPMEAMMHGAVVASSNATCLPEVYGDAVHYFDPLNVQDMARAIDEVITDTELRMTLRERSEKLVTRYSWRRMAQQTAAVYKAVL